MTTAIEEMMFLFDHLKITKIITKLKIWEINSELVKDILEQAAKINQEIVLPLAKIEMKNHVCTKWSC